MCPGETFTVYCHRTEAFLHIYNAKHPKVYLFSLLGYITNKKKSNFHQVYLNCSLTGWRNIKIKYSFSTIPKTVPNAYFGYNFCIWLKIGALNASFFWRSIQNISNHMKMKLYEPNHAFFLEKSNFFKRFPGTSHFKRCPKKYMIWSKWLHFFMIRYILKTP